MACNFQRLAVQRYGEKKIKILEQINDSVIDFRFVRLKYGLSILDRIFFIPCGTCIECKLQKARDMANRIMLECKEYNDNWGVTLTYDDDHLPYGKTVLTGDGEYKKYPTLVPEHLSKFNKALRQIMFRRFGHLGIKFYGAGEYGSEKARSHLHFIYMNLPLPADDVYLCKGEFSDTGEQLYGSHICDKAWSYVVKEYIKIGKRGKLLKNPKVIKHSILRGRVRINPVSWNWACYVARYVMKKQYGQDSAVYETLGIEKEFTRCSTKEGIGKRFFERNKVELLKTDSILIKQGDKVVHASLPPYFLRLAEKEGLDISELKQRRQKRAQDALYFKCSQISQDYGDYCREMEEQKKNTIKGLPRTL